MKGPVSLLQWTEGTTGKDLVAHTRKLEQLGYHELWLPELFGRDPCSTAGYLLASTSSINVSSGIANIYVRDADLAAQSANGLAEMSDGRFRLGLGVSHPVLIEPRGHEWMPPVKKMRRFIERLKEAPIESPRAAKAAPVIVAGHGKGLMRVAGEMADGSFLFLQPIEAVAAARKILGPNKEIHVAVRCVLDDNAETARNLARRACAGYIGLPAYQSRWLECGFVEEDWADGGSDRLIDAVCAWGDADTLVKKLDAFFDAGATHVVLYPANPDEDYRPDYLVSKKWNWPLLEALGPGG